MIHAEAANFDCGVKNYKPRRLIVNPVHLKNELLYNIDRTNKKRINVSLVSYVNNSKDPKKFLNIMRDLELSGLENTFNFFINLKGNLFTNVEMSDDNYFYDRGKDTINVVICLNGYTSHRENTKKASDLYSYDQLKTLSRMLELFRFNSNKVTYSPLSVTNELVKITNIGFDISTFVRNRGLDG